MTNSKKLETGIWLDHKKAFIMNVKGNAVETTKITSEVERKHKSTGGTRARMSYSHRSVNSSRRLEAHRGMEVRKFLKLLKDAIGNPRDLVILGPGIAKIEFRDYLLKHGYSEEQCKNFETTDSRLTKRQIVALMRRRSNKVAPRSLKRPVKLASKQ